MEKIIFARSAKAVQFEDEIYYFEGLPQEFVAASLEYFSEKVEVMAG